jgi:hypothetical protein
MPPFSFDPATLPPYPEGYLNHRYQEYQAFDILPLWARKALRRCKREWQATQILERLQNGDLPLDIIAGLERCEEAYSAQHLDEHTLTNYEGEIWRLRKQDRF